MKAFADCLTTHYEQPQFAFLLAKHLAAILQKQENILAYLSYGQTVTGAMLVHETEQSVMAMFPLDVSQSLEARLVLEAQQLGKTALILEEVKGCDYLLKLERWTLE